MIHEMKLNEKPFNQIKDGNKKIELRLYDEKRQKINLNDTIIFHKITNLEEIIEVRIVGLLRYNSFEDLFKDVDYNLSGYANTLEEKLNSINEIYSKEEENKYGILAIRIEKV